MKFMKVFLVVILTVTPLLMLYWAVMPNNSPSWTGFGSYDDQVLGPRAKTLWDWMELLIVPVVVAIGVWWLSKSEKDAEREIAKQKDTIEQKIAAERQWQATLEAYFDRMTDLLLHENLRSSQKGEVETIARARTLAIMQSLDPTRKGQVITFLYESNLLERNDPVIKLHGADLMGTELGNANLSEVNLSNAQFIRANLSHATLNRAVFTNCQFLENTNFTAANLKGAILSYADLTGALLENAELDDADLSHAILNNANLHNAILANANLQNAELNGADLQGANLHKANLVGAKLNGAKLSSYSRTHLRDANLMGASLVNADLNGADLTDANLMGANMIGTKLEDALLRGAILSDVFLGSTNQLRYVKSLDGATLPDGTTHDGRAILSNISRSDVLEAIKEMDKRWTYRHPHSSFKLKYRGKSYPLDYLITYVRYVISS